MIVKSRQGVSRGGSGQEIPSVAVGAAPEQIQFRITILQAAFGGGRIVPPPLRRKGRKPLPPDPGLGVPDEGDDHDHCEKNTKEKKGAWWNLVVEAMVFQTCELVTEVQFTAKEEDSDPVIRRIVEPSGSSFQGLDLTIEPLTDRIGNTV